MRLHDGTVISRAEVSPHKFGGDPMAEYLWVLSLDSSYDRCTGDAIDWHYWVAQYGRRLEVCYPSGAVEVWKFDNQADADAEFEAIESQYCEAEDGQEGI